MYGYIWGTYWYKRVYLWGIYGYKYWYIEVNIGIYGYIWVYGSTQPGWIFCQKLVIFCLTLSHYCDHFRNGSIKSELIF